MSDSSWARVPSGATLSPKPFRIVVPEKDIDELKTLLRLSRITAPTYESTREDRRFGVTHKFVTETVAHWRDGGFDWRKQEARINAFPQFTVDVPFRDGTFTVHFVALFSSRANAPAVIASHGWPGSFFEFIPMCETLTAKYNPDTIPFHLIIPSLPGYGWSSKPSADADFDLRDVVNVFDNLMNGLGFQNGYLAQGGDLGCFISRMLLQKSNCRAAHLNMLPTGPPPDAKGDEEDERTRYDREQRAKFTERGSAYAQEHATRPATIGFALSSNPVSLLAWVLEKTLEWTDKDLSLDDMLTLISLHWFTDAIATTIYPYRQLMDNSRHDEFQVPMTKPFGFSYFPHELFVTPWPWTEAVGNLQHYSEHKEGGHFAAWEQNQVLLADVTDFVKQIWAQ